MAQITQVLQLARAVDRLREAQAEVTELTSKLLACKLDDGDKKQLLGTLEPVKDLISLEDVVRARFKLIG